MTNRAQLCDLRARLEQIAGELRTAEDAIVSRNGAHELGRAASMAGAASEFVTRALSHPLGGSAELVR